MFKWFVSQFPTISQKMNTIYCCDSICSTEDNLLLYTQKLLNERESLETKEHMLWALLLHNIGRIYTQTDFEGMGVYLGVEVLNKTDLTQIEKIRIIKILSEYNNMIILLNKTKPNYDKFISGYEYEEELLKDILNFLKCLKKDIPLELESKILATKEKSKIYIAKEYSVNIYVGSQATGKSTIINKTKNIPSMVISRDNCMLEIGKHYNLTSYDEVVAVYNKDRRFSNAVNTLDDSYEEIASDYPFDLYIDNLNLRHSHRWFWVKQKGDTHNIDVKVLLKPLNEILVTIEKRKQEENKSVPLEMIIKRMKKFQIPLRGDGYDSVEFVFD